MQAADIVLFRGNSLLSNLIRWATRSKGEPETIVNHVGIMVSETEIVESLTRTVQHPFVMPAKNCWVYRKTDLTPAQRAIIAAKAQSYVGRKYGWLKIVAHAADHLLFGNWYVARRLCRLDRYPICSWVMAYAYAKIEYLFRNSKGENLPPNVVVPDDVWDTVTTQPDWQPVL